MIKINKLNLKNILEADTCPIRLVLDRIGEKWSMLILLLLRDHGVMRFNEIDKAIGDISQKMLAKTLKTLEADGFITRKVYPTVPPKVEYTLTELGLDLVPYIENISVWAFNNLETILNNRKEFEK
ncbi:MULTISPECIES: winged helix-turn-helix transcriptional regulator [Myroides]|nr:helix-turn-helix domain-containing protein [Myroides sp.]